MDTYLTMLYISLEQELALKAFFKSKGWSYTKADLSMVTDKVGPLCPAKTPGPDTSAPSPRSQRKAARAASSAQTQSKTPSKRGTASNAVSPTKVPITSHNEAEAEQGVDDLDFDIIENEDYDEDGDDDFADDLMDEEDNAEISGEKELTTKTTAMTRSGRKSKPTEKAAAAAMASKSSRGSLKSPTKKLIPKIVLKRERAETDATESTSTKRARNDDGTEKGDENIGEEMTHSVNESGVDPEEGLSGCEYFDSSRAGNQVMLDNTQKEFICETCGLSYSTKSSLKYHIDVKHEGKPSRKRTNNGRNFQCTICGFAFKRKAHLQEHTHVKHKDASTVLRNKCELCDMSFIRKNRLIYHMNKEHFDVKPFTCSHCGQGFYNNRSCQQHIYGQICQDKSLRQYGCKHCDQRFSRKSMLENHLIAKHFGGAFDCPCGKTVRWNTSIQKHKNRCKVYQECLLNSGGKEKAKCEVIEIPYDIEDQKEDSTVDESGNGQNIDGMESMLFFPVLK